MKKSPPSEDLAVNLRMKETGQSEKASCILRSLFLAFFSLRFLVPSSFPSSVKLRN